MARTIATVPNRARIALENRQVTAMEVTDARRGASIYILISGQPVSQPRPRFATTRTLRTYVYNPASREKRFIAGLIKRELQETGLQAPPATPKSPVAPTFNGRVMVEATFGVADMTKDLDNMLKFALDVLEEARVYSNDRLVRKIGAEKVDSDTGYTILAITPYD